MESAVQIANKLHSGKYRADIDGLRAIAVTTVVLCHAFPYLLPGGFIGVDIFFVISGYLITSIILEDLDRERFSLGKFYDRRIRRIFPGLVALLFATIGLGWICLFRPEFQALGQHIVASSLFGENFLLWSEASYFDVSSALKPTLHLWSLSIEEQFYILWPLALLWAHRLNINYFVVSSAFLILYFGFDLYYIHTDPTAAYYSPLGRSWELMIGAILAYCHRRHPRAFVRYADLQSFIGLGLIIAALVLINAESAFPGFWALLPTMGAFLLLACGKDAWVNRHLLSLRPMIWCGLISYPLYLWHWFFLSFAHIIFLHLTVAKSAVCIVLSVIFAIGTFFYLERPFRTGGGGARAIVKLTAAMILVLVLGLLAATRILPPRQYGFDAPSDNEWAALSGQIKDNNRDQVNVYRLAAERPAQVLFIGDSHVAQYVARLSPLLSHDARRPGVVLALGGDCIAVPGARTDNLKRQDCWPLRDKAYRMADDPTIARIVIGGSWNAYFLSEGFYVIERGAKVPLNAERGQKLALGRLANVIGKWKSAGKQVALILDNPQDPKFSATDWRIRLSVRLRNYPANAMVAVSGDQVRLHDAMAVWARRLGVTIIDPFAAICRGALCRSTSDQGMPLFRDESHFNPAWVIGHATFVDPTVAALP